MMPVARAPAALKGAPIDRAARNGRVQLLTDHTHFALGKWDGRRWVYPFTTVPLDFTPTEVCR